jgi:hypothetical protein
MMKIIRNFLVCLILVALTHSLLGQEKDFRSWYTIEVGGELFNFIDISVTPEIRFWDNSSRFEGFLTEGDLSAAVTKFLRFGLNYRYQADFEREDGLHQTNRYGIYGELSQKFSGLKITYRAFYHREYTDINNSELGSIPLSQHRHKLSLKYSRKGWKLSPSVSAEMFFTLSPEWNAFQEKLRFSAGMQYKLTKKIDLELGYKYQQEYFEKNPLTSNILCVGAGFEF